jgi:hypothetical protein
MILPISPGEKEITANWIGIEKNRQRLGNKTGSNVQTPEISKEIDSELCKVSVEVL